jgi:hypothetical protein
MTKWEYTTFTLVLDDASYYDEDSGKRTNASKKDFINNLNTLGDRGWEATAMSRYVVRDDYENEIESALILLKRPKS